MLHVQSVLEHYPRQLRFPYWSLLKAITTHRQHYLRQKYRSSCQLLK